MTEKDLDQDKKLEGLEHYISNVSKDSKHLLGLVIESNQEVEKLRYEIRTVDTNQGHTKAALSRHKDQYIKDTERHDKKFESLKSEVIGHRVILSLYSAGLALFIGAILGGWINFSVGGH